MDRQTDGKTTQTGRNTLTKRTKPHGLDIQVSTDGKQGQTDKLDEPTNGRADNLTNGLMNWKEGPCGRPNRLDGRTQEPEGRTDQTDRKDGSNGLDVGTDAQNQWIKRTDTRTHGADACTG